MSVVLVKRVLNLILYSSQNYKRRNAGDGPDPTAMEDEDGLCYSTRIKGQSICPARIRQEPQKKAM